MLWCRFCEQHVEGLTLYLAGVSRLFVCEACYGLLVAKEHQPYSKPMQRLRRLLWDSTGEEVVTDEGLVVRQFCFDGLLTTSAERD